MRQHREPTAEVLAMCSDLLLPSPNPVSDATAGSLAQDIALMRLYGASPPAVVCTEVIYRTVNLIAFHECKFHVQRGV